MAEQEIPQLSEEELEEMEDMQDELLEDQQADNVENSQELGELYGSPEPEERHNQHTFLDNAVKAKDTVRTTYLDEWELGRQMINVRY